MMMRPKRKLNMVGFDGPDKTSVGHLEKPTECEAGKARSPPSPIDWIGVGGALRGALHSARS